MVATLVVVAVGTVGLGLLYQAIAPVQMYDSNFDTFDQILGGQQKEGIMGCLRAITGVYILLLVVSNLAWTVGAIYMLRQYARDSRLLAEQ